MRIFFDARDLIEIFNHRRPLSIGEMGKRFSDCGHQLVVPFSLICELVPADNNPIVVARRFVSLEEDVPLVFVQQVGILDSEISTVSRAFANGTAAPRWNPFVDSFHELWSGHADPIMRLDLERTVGMNRMSKQIDFLLINSPEVFHWTSHERTRAALHVDQERTATEGKREKHIFADATRGWIRRSGVGLSEAQEDALTKVLRRTPSQAPAWQLYEEVFGQIVRDTGYKPTGSDLWDLAHVMLIPYVDFMTLDGQKIEMVRRAARRLRRFDSGIRYDAIVKSNVLDVLTEIDC
jgi:hypothetical protein